VDQGALLHVVSVTSDLTTFPYHIIFRFRLMKPRPDIKTPEEVLVFLPLPAAQVIVARLEESGHFATAMQSVAELVGALGSDAYSLVVTTRADIDVVRNIKAVPVVNLEVFFHTVKLTDETVTASKQFDGAAFIERIRLLQEPRRER
jgi:hypothetical protein